MAKPYINIDSETEREVDRCLREIVDRGLIDIDALVIGARKQVRREKIIKRIVIGVLLCAMIGSGLYFA